MEVVHGEEIEVDDEGSASGELAVGLKIPSSVKAPTGYLDSLRKYKDIYNDIYQQIEVCNKLYKYNGIVGNAVDILVDFAVTNVRPLPTGDEKLDKVLDHWFSHLNDNHTSTMPGVYPLMQEIALEWFTSGNAFPYKRWENVTIDKKGVYKLPMGVSLINPLSIHIPTAPLAFGQEIIYLKYDSDLVAKLKTDGRKDPEAAILKASVPKSVVRAVNSNSSMFTEGIRLNPKYITHLKRRAKTYQAWGVPYLSRCFSATSLLERLRELDESITSGLINLITIFKIGTEEHPASDLRLRRFASLLRNPKATTTLVWAHDVEVIQHGPDGKILAFKDKYKDAKQDALISLGIPPVLMSLDQSGDEWVSILSLIERLSHWRKTVSIWLEQTCNEIAKHNGFEDARVKVKWDRMNLTDESSIKNLVMAFYDRGLISIKTTLHESGYDLEREKTAKEIEKPFADLFVPPELPFSTDKKPETSKGNPGKDSLKTKKDKKSSTKSENTVDLKEKKKRSKPTK